MGNEKNKNIDDLFELKKSTQTTGYLFFFVPFFLILLILVLQKAD